MILTLLEDAYWTLDNEGFDQQAEAVSRAREVLGTLGTILTEDAKRDPASTLEMVRREVLRALAH